MGRNAYQTCKKIIEALNERGITFEVPYNTLVETIRIVAGESRQTLAKYMRLLHEWKFIEKINNNLYRIIIHTHTEGKE